ncbi:protein-methionine-sulfoxide reductase catalytic subunit MsrP [Geminicoccaceae bacterium 1502E]|nr:protein-methionine-sulfoxide reductase catalytic subunit MsrP [Geminicoccaceae bacterium 1502E]
MLTRVRRSWEMREGVATDEAVYLRRRAFMTGVAAAPLVLSAAGRALLAASPEGVAGELYPAARNTAWTLDRPLTAEGPVTSFNNFYEFGGSKRIAGAAQALKLEPWAVTIDGLVEKPVTLDVEDLIRKMPLEERLYRHRCVEAWAMAVPWTGFPLKALLDLARPLGSAKYLRMETFHDPDVAPGQRSVLGFLFDYPWPYVEGLTMAEAANELAFIGTGLYGKPMPKQNGAPLRLVTPWKYGFKSVKSLVRFSFTEERPKGFWEIVQGSEYGFWANVNPAVPHPRWSQAEEEMLGTGERRPTQLFNGYGEQVAHLYEGLADEPLYM